MTNQNKRAVESMIRCGLALEEVIANFPKLDRGEVEELYKVVKEITGEVVEVPVLKVNCS